jgi:hypothetical protein
MAEETFLDGIEQDIRNTYHNNLKMMTEKVFTEASDGLLDYAKGYMIDNLADIINDEVDRRVEVHVAAILRGEPEYLSKYSLAIRQGYQNYKHGEYDPHGIRRKLVEDFQHLFRDVEFGQMVKQIKDLKRTLERIRTGY